MSTGWRKRGGGMNKQSDSVGEPVAWAMLHDNGVFIDAINPDEHARIEGEYTHPLYTKPQLLKPLTDERIWQLVNDCTIGGDLHADKFARAIEVAHGIKE